MKALTSINRLLNCSRSYGYYRFKSTTFHSKDLKVTLTDPNELRPKPNIDNLVFGTVFSDHMLRIKWCKNQGWNQPRITPLENFQMHPAAKVLHYAQELFEGMKAYRGDDGEVRLFRPMHNMTRMVITAKRACFPIFEEKELLDCIRKLIQIDQEWVPHSSSSSLYIRPSMIATEPTLGIHASADVELFVILSPCGPYFSTGVKPVNLMADSRYVRAWPGGCGFAKMGSNYAPTLWISNEAEKLNCQQALWLYGPDKEITEVGAMNLFCFFDHGNGRRELVTSGLESGLVLPGVTRRSVLELARKWDEFEVNERKLTMDEVLKGSTNGSLIEMFGTGTAAIVSPIGNIYIDGKMRKMPVPTYSESLSQRFSKELTDIYYGRNKHPWAMNIEEWQIDAEEAKRVSEYKTSLEKHFQ